MVLWLLACALALLPLDGAGARGGDGAARHEERMLADINDERERRGLRPLRRDRRLDQAAADHTRRMARARRLAHQLRGEPNLRTRIAATGLRFSTVGENVGYSTRVEDLHPNLMRSRGHRAHLLSSKYDAIGLAIARSDERFYVTQTFARRTSNVSAAQAERAFAEAIADERRRRRLPSAPVDATPALRDAACAMAKRDDLDPKRVPNLPAQRKVIVFTTFEPGELERGALELAIDPDLGRVTFGVCHRETRSYPSGVFWFAVAY